MQLTFPLGVLKVSLCSGRQGSPNIRLLQQLPLAWTDENSQRLWGEQFLPLNYNLPVSCHMTSQSASKGWADPCDLIARQPLPWEKKAIFTGYFSFNRGPSRFNHPLLLVRCHYPSELQSSMKVREQQRRQQTPHSEWSLQSDINTYQEPPTSNRMLNHT